MAEETIAGGEHVGEFNSINPAYNMTFYNEEKMIGKLDWSDGVLKFTGDAEESAKLLFEFLKPAMDQYMKGVGTLVFTERNTGESDEDFVSRHLINKQVDVMNKGWRERIKGGKS